MKFLEKAYLTLILLGSLLQSPVLLLCRLYWGGLFMLGGWEKLNNISHFITLLKSYHFIFPEFMSYLAVLTEFIGGMLLIIGFASRLVSVPLIITMLTAYATVHIASLYVFFQTPSVFVAESPFNFLLTALLVLAFGPGYFSVDYLLERKLFLHVKKYE